MSDAHNRQLESIKLHMFLTPNGVFLSSLMCLVKYSWDSAMPAPAKTDGKSIVFNPKFWDNFSQDSRKFALKHELEHIARLYWLRRGTRDNRLWNAACDYIINQDAFDQGFKIPDFKVLYNPDFKNKSEEEVYEILLKDPQQVPDWFEADVDDATSEEQVQIVSMVIEANNTAKAAGQVGMGGNQELLISEFLSPKADWRTELRNLHLEMAGRKRTLVRQGRRSINGLVTPYYKMDKDRLAHLAYFVDMSLSTTDENVQQFLSELRYIWTEIAPLKMTIFGFDEEITSELEIVDGDSLDNVTLLGRNGTDFECVRQKIEEIKPTAAIILSDMECLPMEPLSCDCDIFWGVVRNPDVDVPFGKVINLD